MIVTCINKGRIKNLTEGKKYKVVRKRKVEGLHQDSYIRYSGFWIINDSGIERYYSSKRFLDVLEWREKKLNELGL
jgi:hypothetical protein